MADDKVPTAAEKELASKTAKEVGTTTADLLKESERIVTMDKVKFKVDYPKDYKGTKHFANGATVEVHPDVAKQFTERGIGKVLS